MKHARHVIIDHHEGRECRKCYENFPRGSHMIVVSGVDDRVWLCMPCVAKLCTSRSSVHVIAGPIISRRTVTIGGRA